MVSPPRPEPSSHQAADPNPNANTSARRFFIPTSTFASPTIPSSRSSFAFDPNIHGDNTGFGSSYSASGSHGSYGVISPSRIRKRGRGQSLAVLTSALQTYRVPPEPEAVAGTDDLAQKGEVAVSEGNGEAGPSTAPQTPPRDRNRFQIQASDPSLDTAFTSIGGHSSGGHVMPRNGGGREYGIDPEIMDALVEIHRVLYGGREDEAGKGMRKGWREEVDEVDRVTKRWFESDCVYDHPLLRLRSRLSLKTHFSLLHLIADGSIPALTPSNVIFQMRNIVYRLKRRALRSLGLRQRTRSISSSRYEAKNAGSGLKDGAKGKGKERAQAEKAGYASQVDSTDGDLESDMREGEIWKLWEVGAECTEIGGMECYDGYHRGFIEHIITFTLLPTWTRPPINTPQLSTSPSFASSDLQLQDDPGLHVAISTPNAIETRSFGERLGRCLGKEFGYLVRWELPISTIVQFNEVGKVTHMRDTIDIRDFIETFVPFAKRLNWISRRISGLVLSAFGGVLLSTMLPISEGKVSDGKRLILVESQKMDISSYDKLMRDISPTNTDRDMTTIPIPNERGEINSLGLAGLDDLGTEISSVRYLSGMRGGAGMAPDRDDAV